MQSWCSFLLPTKSSVLIQVALSITYRSRKMNLICGIQILS
jgi:hypothetical protein